MTHSQLFESNQIWKDIRMVRSKLTFVLRNWIYSISISNLPLSNWGIGTEEVRAQWIDDQHIGGAVTASRGHWENWVFSWLVQGLEDIAPPIEFDIENW